MPYAVLTDGTTRSFAREPAAAAGRVAASSSSPLHSPGDVRSQQQQAEVGGMLPEHLRSVPRSSPIRNAEGSATYVQAEVHSAPGEQLPRGGCCLTADAFCAML